MSLIRTAVSFALVTALASPGFGEDPAAKASDAEKTAPAAKAATPSGADEGFELRRAVEGAIGAPVHGTLGVRYRYRETNDEKDQDADLWLRTRVGNENVDEWAGNLSLRATSDWDRSSDDPTRGHTFSSLEDTFDSRVNARLYTAYAVYRPGADEVDSIRIGRQYVYAGETFHVDGFHAQSAVLEKDYNIRASVYGGVPVHLYESSPSGDWIAGLRISGQPWKRGRVTLDYTHVDDDLVRFGEQNDDLVSLSAWQSLGTDIHLHGKVSYLDDVRDATVRATYELPDEDFMVQASYYRLFEDQREFSTEFDHYYAVLKTLKRYHQARLRAVKGFGDDYLVEAGFDLRDLVPGERESTFNRDVHRYYVTGSADNLPWKGTTLSATVDVWSSDGERFRTFSGEVRHAFGKKFEAAIGSDYAIYAFSEIRGNEVNDVRTVYGELEYPLSDDLTLDFRVVWEDDDEETYRVFTLGLEHAF